MEALLTMLLAHVVVHLVSLVQFVKQKAVKTVVLSIMLPTHVHAFQTMVERIVKI